MRSSDSVRNLNMLRLLVVLGSLALFIFYRLKLGAHAYADSGFRAFNSGNRTADLVEFSTNAFFSWTFESNLHLLFGTPGLYEFYMGIMLIICSLGFLKLQLWYLRERDAGELAPLAAVLSLSICACTIFLFGLDTVIFSLLLFLPWQMTAVSFILSGYSPSRHVFFIVCFINVLVALFAMQLAILISLISFVVVLGERNIAGHPRLRFALLSTFIPCILASWFVKVPTVPDLPSGGHVVPAWGVSEHYRPLVGSDPAILSYDWGAAREAMFHYALAAFGISLLILLCCEWMLRRRRLERIPIGVPRAAFVLSVFLLLDTKLLPPIWSQIMPLRSLSRLVPEAAYLPLSRYCLALIVPLILLSFLNFGKRTQRAFLLVLALCAFFPLHNGRAAQPLAESLGWSRSKWENAYTMFSPSYAVVRKAGLQRVAALSRAPQAEGLGVRVSPEEAILRASGGSENAHFVLDENLRTRWSTGLKGQRGDEYFELELRAGSERTLNGLKLDLGNFVSDFPRGLRVTLFDALGRECERVEESPWEGPLLFNRAGFPYFGPQQQVAVRFLNRCRVRRLLVEQTGSDPRFDWSIAELVLQE